jgi:hypothetical protein
MPGSTTAPQPGDAGSGAGLDVQARNLLAMTADGIRCIGDYLPTRQGTTGDSTFRMPTKQFGP